MIGLYYPKIDFHTIKLNLKNNNLIATLLDLINQLEIKLIYMEKEINLTKLVTFYYSRKSFLDKNNITYNEKNLTELHDIVNWIIIHKSSQLKGIASDKYLACKYVKLKLGKNLCEHSIVSYNQLEQLNYHKLNKIGNIVLKISNSCWKTVFISNDTNEDIFKDKMKIIKNMLKSDHGLLDAQFFHLYAKKRILVEKQFIPLKDLYEFKFFIVNNNIKFIYLLFYLNMKLKSLIYDNNFNFLFGEKSENLEPLNMSAVFNKKILNKLKNYAIKLSEDFPNFIRVDLYIFHNRIYLSELTFASCNGFPFYKNEQFVKDSVKDFKRIDDYY